MITTFRRYLEKWYVRAFFVIMVGSFVFWGVGDVVRMVGNATWVVKVAGQTIEGQFFQTEYQRAMSAATRDLPQGQEVTPDLKRKVGDTAMQRIVGEAAMSGLLRDMRLQTPTATIATAVRGMPVFKDNVGQFSKQQFDLMLRNNGLNEQRFLQSVRIDLTQRQLLGAIAAGAVAPRMQAEPVFAAVFEKRAADMVEFLFARAPTVLPADDVTLRRFYDNRPDIYATPEYRRFKATILSAHSVAAEIKITDEDLQAAYDRARASYVTPEKRSAQVVSVGDEVKARALMDTWASAAAGTDDWAMIQAAAKASDAAAVALDDAPREMFPDPDLAAAVFAAEPKRVVGPVKGAMGWYLVKVPSVTPGSEKTFESVKKELMTRVLNEKATDILYPRANTLDNLLGNGSTLDDLPGDLGLIVVTGTMDSAGKAPDGSTAAIPDPAGLRTALITAAFQARPGDQPRLIEAKTPDGPAYFALVIEDITAPSVKRYEDISARVAGDWMFEQQRRAQEEAASAMLAAIQSGRTFADAATFAGVVPRITPLVSRGDSDPAMPPELHNVLFNLKKAEPTMVETAQGFIIAVPVEIVTPDPKAEPSQFDQMREELSRAIGNDMAQVFVDAVRQRADPRINQTNFDQIVKP